MDLNSWHLFHLTKGPFTKGGQFFGAPLPPKKLENFDIPKDKNIRIEEGEVGKILFFADVLYEWPISKITKIFLQILHFAIFGFSIPSEKFQFRVNCWYFNTTNEHLAVAYS